MIFRKPISNLFLSMNLPKHYVKHTLLVNIIHLT